MRWRCVFDNALALAIAGFVLWAVMGNGLPELRHDWRWPARSFELPGEFESLFDGWSVTNLGEAQPYPTFYWIGMVLYVVRALVTPWSSMALIVAAGAFVAARSAMRLVAGTSLASYATAACVALFAALNPWVYAKEVAGHVFLILAYALLLALLAEVARERPRNTALVLLAAATVTLIEFYAIVVVPLVIWALRTKRPRVAFAAVVAGMPIAYGVIANLHGLAATPYNLAWQDNNSVDLGQGALLQGYGTLYTTAFSAITFASIALGILAVTGLDAAWRRPLFRTAIVTGVVCLFAASGTKGPLAHPYAFVVVHLKASGLYRELYDLIAFVAIAYVVLLARGIVRFRVAAIAGSVCALVFVVPWMRVPPRSFTVSAARLPEVHFRGDGQTRVALYPAFQPMSLQGVGSGTDPDLHTRPGEDVPINGFLPTYPVDAALVLGASGDANDLRALGVASEVARPYLHVDAEAVRFQTALGAAKVDVPIPRRLAALPVLGVVAGSPEAVTIGNRPAEFGIVAVPSLRVPVPSARTYDAHVAWIDARLTTMDHPDWASIWGGAATSSNLPLAIERDRAVLAAADGEIVDDRGSVVAERSSALHWHHLHDGIHALYCRGACVVAAFGDPPPLPEHAALAHVAALHFERRTPWLVTTTMSARAGDTIRFAERYDSSWKAFAGIRELHHEALATALNAWTIDRTYAHQHVILIETTAATQLVLELLAMLSILFVTLSEARSAQSTGVSCIITARAAPRL